MPDITATCPIMPLETFREQIGHHPFHFWQLSNSTQVPVTNRCGIIREYSYQSAQSAGRQDIRQAIISAEETFQKYLNYSVAKRFNTDIFDLPCPQHFYGPFMVSLREGMLQRIITQTWTFIINSTVVYSDVDGDGLNDTFNLTVTDSTTEVDDIGVFFQTTDRFDCDEDTACKWQILPVKVTRTNANTLNICGRSWLLVKPIKYQGFNLAGEDNNGGFNPTNAANFVTELAVYKRTYTGENEITLTYTGCSTEQVSTPCALVLDGRLGQIKVPVDSCSGICLCGFNYGYYAGYGYGYYNGSIFSLSLPRLTATINYEAGANIKDWKTILTRLAIAELPLRICGDPASNLILAQWQNDRAITKTFGSTGTGEQFTVSAEDINNPIGTKAGQIYAWHIIKALRLGMSVHV